MLRRVAQGIAALSVTAGAITAVLVVLVLVAIGINGVARWKARHSEVRTDPAVLAEQARGNLLVIGAEEKVAEGMLALKVERDEERVFGIAIPEGAFIEVPGQGFERIGESFRGGARASMAAVSNYLGVPFERHVVVSAEAYQTALKSQSLAHLLDEVTSTDLDAAEEESFRRQFAATPSQKVALVPLPIRPINLGDTTYYEPVRDEIADVLRSVWGVEPTEQRGPLRVIIHNGSGIPGIAGKAAERLISKGFRVMSTQNADRFDYRKTQIVLQHGERTVAVKVREALGVGDISRQDAEQEIADVIVIIGRDFAPPAKDG